MLQPLNTEKPMLQSSRPHEFDARHETPGRGKFLMRRALPVQGTDALRAVSKCQALVFGGRGARCPRLFPNFAKAARYAGVFADGGPGRVLRALKTVLSSPLKSLEIDKYPLAFGRGCAIVL